MVPHFRITALGHLGTSSTALETFSWSFAVGGPTGDLVTDAQAASVLTAVQNFHASAAGLIKSHAYLDSVKIAAKGADGRNLYDSKVAIPTAPVAGGSTAGAVAPFQLARVITLNARTANRHSKGRFYLPAPAFTGIDFNTGKDTTPGATLDGLLTAVNTMFDAVETAMLGPVCVAGSTGNTPVTAVRVGDVIDTVRSRRAAIKETYRQAVHNPS